MFAAAFNSFTQASWLHATLFLPSYEKMVTRKGGDPSASVHSTNNAGTCLTVSLCRFHRDFVLPHVCKKSRVE